MLTADNLHFFLEVSRTGRVADAARRLGVDHTTVSRRISRLEKQLGVRLFDRASAGWRLTEAGHRLIPHAESMESLIQAAVEATRGTSEEALSGTARILAPDGFGSYVLVPGLAQLRNAHPDLAIELVTSTTHDLISTRDYDIAITLEYPPPRAVVITELARYRLQFYASRGYLGIHPTPRSLGDLQEHTIIWYVNASLDVEPLRELYSLVPDLSAQIQTNNITGQYLAARSGLGIAPLPTYIGGADDQLVSVLEDDFVIERTYWLVVPRELSRLPRVRVITDLLKSIVLQHDHLGRLGDQTEGSERI